MDEFDRASELEMASRNHAIAAQRAEIQTVSLADCKDCGDAIPLKRQAVGGITRCIACQEHHEKMENKYAK